MSMTLFEKDVIFLQRFLKLAGFYAGKVDGDWGPKADAAVKAFDTRSQEIAEMFGTVDARSERHIWTLHPKAQDAARTFLTKVRDAGIDARIISGTRTYAEQNARYKQGRFGNPGRKVTNARGGQSNHNFGVAWDIGIFDHGAYLGESPLYKEAANIRLVPGLEWGGNWETFKDQPHYQLPTGLSMAAVRQHFEDGLAFV